MRRLSLALRAFAGAQAAVAVFAAAGLLDPDPNLFLVVLGVSAVVGTCLWVASDLDSIMPEEGYYVPAMVLAALYVVGAMSYMLVDLDLAELPALLLGPAAALVPVAHVALAWKMTGGDAMRSARRAVLAMAASMVLSLATLGIAAGTDQESLATVSYALWWPVPLASSAASAAMVATRVTDVS